jgi:methylmalonic aciduria homocystinuria type C protein
MWAYRARVVDPALAARCAAAGFDLIAPCAVTIDDALIERFDRPRALGLVIGNTRALWPRFLDALAADPALRAEADPLDRYTERSLRAAVADARAAIYFAHAPTPRGYVPMQALAVRAGLAALSPTGLCVHPIYGPWIALRAFIAVDADGPVDAAPIAQPCDCTDRCAPLRAALDLRAARFAPDEHGWQAWLAMRDACPIGRAHRYGDDQIAYHYTRDRARLVGG